MSTVVSDTSDIQETKRGWPESRVWDHFTKASLGSGHYSAKCHYCFASWPKGRPETLKSHLTLYCDQASLNIKAITAHSVTVIIISTATITIIFFIIYPLYNHFTIIIRFKFLFHIFIYL